MKQNICVFDFETDGSNPKLCQPVQLAAVMIHPRTLDVIEGSEFSSFMKPDGIDTEEYFTDAVMDTINWHSRNYKTTPEEIIKSWKEAPDQKVVWKQWLSYLKRYNVNQSNKTMWTAPIRGGHNIRSFDITIMDRLCVKYGDVQAKNGEQKIFYPRDVVDIKEIAFYWFENLSEPEALNMDALRIFFGMPTDGGHDALNDVKDEAWMISKFLKLHRRMAPKIAFKGSANVDTN